MLLFMMGVGLPEFFLLTIIVFIIFILTRKFWIRRFKLNTDQKIMIWSFPIFLLFLFLSLIALISSFVLFIFILHD
jgi:uncharacterized membrane protein YozB (DUF420 family)